MYNILLDIVEHYTQYIMKNCSLILRNIAILVKTYERLVSKKQNISYFVGNLNPLMPGGNKKVTHS